ncbi:hypothetical protein [Nitrospira sp. BLG_2]|uniref:hypothetical protein n=1 Tax=Nitrospira sp. BLG_2 TaxID=3397507 RepID=UPI003B9CE9D6
MLVWKKILWLRERVHEQKKWIDRCGGSLSGYIENYGDPGVPPLKDGKPHILTVPENKQHFFSEHERVPGTTDQFYANHYGDGGTAIYEADYNRLMDWQRQLNDLEIRNHAAKVKADDMAGKVKVSI